MKSMGDRLKRQADWLGIPDAEVARRVGIDPTRYNHYVAGRHQPTLEMFLAICRSLEITPDQAFGFTPLPGESPDPPPTPTDRDRAEAAIRFDLEKLSDGSLEAVRRLVRELAGDSSARK